MNRARKIAIGVSLALLILGVAGSFMTQGVMEHLPFLHGQKAGWNEVIIPHGIVDQRPWQTAATLSALAVSTEERELAREAERLADHEVDQADEEHRRAHPRDQSPVRRVAGSSHQRRLRSNPAALRTYLLHYISGQPVLCSTG